MIRIELELTKLATREKAQKWANSPSFLDPVAEDKWFFNGGTGCWLVVNLTEGAQVASVRKAAADAGMDTFNAHTLSIQEVIESVVNEELSKL